MVFVLRQDLGAQRRASNVHEVFTELSWIITTQTHIHTYTVIMHYINVNELCSQSFIMNNVLYTFFLNKESNIRQTYSCSNAGISGPLHFFHQGQQVCLIEAAF